MNSSVKILLFWLALVPLCIIFVCHRMVSLKPTAFAKLLCAHHKIKTDLEYLNKKVIALLQQPSNEQNNIQRAIRLNQIKALNHKLSFYEQDRTYYHPRFSKYQVFCGNAYMPFVFLLWLASFFLCLALSPACINFMIQLSSLIIGSLLCIISIIQFIFACILVPTWYAKISGLIFIPIMLISLTWCWIQYIQRNRTFKYIQKR